MDAQEPQPLRSLFHSALNLKKELENSADSTSDVYKDQLRNAINQLEECQRRIAQVSLFSSNEGLEDINTNDLPCVQSFSCD